MRSILSLLIAVAVASVAFGVDPKEKAKAKACAAIAMESARAKAVISAASPAKSDGPLHDLDKAKTLAVETGKPLVLWVGQSSKDAVKEVDAVHCEVKEFVPVPDAKCVVFTCKGGKCDRKSSTSDLPSADLLRAMIGELPAKKKPAPASNEFFIGTDAQPATASDDDNEGETFPIQTPVGPNYRKVCTVDEFGRKTCRWELVPQASEAKPAPAVVAPNAAIPAGSVVLDCPTCNVQQASYASASNSCSCPSCSCESCGQTEKSAGSGRFVLFPRLRAAAQAVFSEDRPRLFGGRLFGGCRSCR